MDIYVYIYKYIVRVRVRIRVSVRVFMCPVVLRPIVLCMVCLIVFL